LLFFLEPLPNLFKLFLSIDAFFCLLFFRGNNFMQIKRLRVCLIIEAYPRVAFFCLLFFRGNNFMQIKRLRVCLIIEAYPRVAFFCLLFFRERKVRDYIRIAPRNISTPYPLIPPLTARAEITKAAMPINIPSNIATTSSENFNKRRFFRLIPARQ